METLNHRSPALAPSSIMFVSSNQLFRNHSSTGIQGGFKSLKEKEHAIEDFADQVDEELHFILISFLTKRKPYFSLHGSSIYGYGSERHGQIGIKLSQGRRTSIIPKVILGFEDSRIVCVCANGDHSAALSAHGQLYTWGRGFNGRPHCHQPQLLTSLLMFSQVALGWNHALLVSDGQVYMLGRMLTHVQQSTREHQDSNMPFFHESAGSPLLKRITNLIGERVVGIAAGAEHSAVVTDTGTVMTWGWGEHGQLGLGDTDDRILPQRVCLGSKGSGSCPSLRVFCGSGFTFVSKYG